MTAPRLLAISLTDAGSIAGIVAAAVAVVLAVVGALSPTRKFLSRWRLFSSWILTQKEREQVQRAIAQKEADEREKEASKHAELEFELQSNGSTKLVIHNVGRCPARNVVVWGQLSPRAYNNEMTEDGYGKVGSYGTIPPGGSRSDYVSVSDYQIEFGATQWRIRSSWDDDAGEHRGEARRATQWT